MINPTDPATASGAEELIQSSFPAFMKPYTAVRKLEHYCGGSYNAKLLIADKIRDGAVRAYARRAWVSDEVSLKSSRREPPDGVECRVSIPRNRLIGAESWTENISQWKWRAGDFFAVIRSKPVRRRHFRDVRLARDDIEKILIDVQDAQKRKLSNRGRPTKNDAWNAVWVEVLRLAQNGNLTKAALGDMQRFRRLVMEEASKPNKKPPLDDETVAPLLNSIYREFVDANAI